MKGSLHTDEIMGAIVPASAGLRTSRRISHAFVMDVATYPKMFIMTDAAVNIFPNLEVKRDIVQNAIDLSHALGVEMPKVGILSAVEVINSKIPSTLDAAALCKMADRGQITGGILDGPLAFDNAISAQAAKDQGDHLARQRRCGHPAGAGSRIGQHALQAAHLPGRGRRGRHRARNPDPRCPHKPCRLDQDAARLGGGHGRKSPTPGEAESSRRGERHMGPSALIRVKD